MTRFEFTGSLLQVFDEQNIVAWSHTFEGPPTPVAEANKVSRLVDIDNDGKMELLFVRYAADEGSILYFFRSDGTVGWQLAIGRSIVDGRGRSLLRDYRTTHLAVLNRSRADGGRIVVSSHHEFSWPHQILVLTAQGRQVAEYWHPGWVFTMALGDLDGDGVEEIILGGVNDSYRDTGPGATLLVLDSRVASGQGPIRPGDARRVQGVPMGQPSAVLLFPDIERRPEPANAFSLIDNVRFVAGHLELGESDGPHRRIHYQLDRRLQLVSVTPTPNVFELQSPNAGPDERYRRLWATFGRLITLKNDFATAPKSGTSFTAVYGVSQ